MKTILPWSFWLLVGVALVWATNVRADPLLTAEQGGVRIIVYSDPCAFKEVENLPKRATWTQDGKTIEGCAGYIPQLEMVQFYWGDKTVIPVPVSFFQKVTGA